MIARKDDPIWTQISRFGTPYPPFDFNSGMETRGIGRREAVALGVIGATEAVQPKPRGFNDDVEAAAPKDERLKEALVESMGGAARMDGDVLRMN